MKRECGNFPVRFRRHLFLALLFVLTGACLSALGQVGPDAAPPRKMPPPNVRPPNPPPKPPQRIDESQRARGLFVSKRSDAMTILVLKNEKGALVPVDPGKEFKAGDLIKVQIESNFEGFIYVVNIQPDGKQCLMFPYRQASNNAVGVGERYEIPPGLDAMEFDQQKGIEILQVIMSRDRIPYLDAAAKEPDRCFAQSTPIVSTKLQTGIVKSMTPAERGLAIRVGATGIRGLAIKVGASSEPLRSRDILLAPGKNKDPKGSVVAVSDAGGSGKLKAGEAALFEIRLKHN